MSTQVDLNGVVCSPVSRMPSSRKLPSALALLLFAMWAVNGQVARAQATPHTGRDGKHVSAGGKQTFASSCAGCHGLDGRGGERAPNIAENPKVQRLADSEICHIIENGIPGAGMPGFHALESSQIKALVAYLRTLQNTKNTVKLPGNPARGETIFFGKTGCSTCHMVAGKGGFIASDLSGYTRVHSIEEIRNAIAKPTSGNDRNNDRQMNDQKIRLVTATVSGGHKYIGRIRNEDNFSLQLQTLGGTFHFISKLDLESLEYNSEPLMPSDYGSILSSIELDDVVSYLMSVSNASRPEIPRKRDEEE
jgi:putative heme-binding domain-containing protein